MSGLFHHRHVHSAAFHIVLDGIAAQVLHDLEHQTPDTGNGAVFTGQPNGDVLFLRRQCQRIGDLLGNIQDVYIFPGHLHTLVQMTQTDHIFNEQHQPGGLPVDIADEAGHILRFDQSVFQQLRAANDGLQGCFQLVGHVGGKLPAVLLRVLYSGNIHRQDHQADHLAAGGNPAQQELIGPALPLGLQLTVALPEGFLHCAGHFRLPVHRAEGFSDAAVVRAEELLRRRVQAQHRAAAIQEHQTLVHIRGDLVEFIRLSLQRLQLVLDPFALLLDTNQQGRQFLIGVVFQRMLQIELVQRLHDLAGYPVCQDR